MSKLDAILEAISNLCDYLPLQSWHKLSVALDRYYNTDGSLDDVFDITLKICDKLMQGDKHFMFAFTLSQNILEFRIANK